MMNRIETFEVNPGRFDFILSILLIHVKMFCWCIADKTQYRLNHWSDYEKDNKCFSS